MNLVLDLPDDEVPIFLAETDEQIQLLDQGLVRLEQEQADPSLIQAIFRAAHTLKGNSGLVGHKRMVELTHALETALDGVRKGSLAITPLLIDLCLETVDAIRILRDEIATREISAVDVDTLVQRFSQLQSQDLPVAKPGEGSFLPAAQNLIDLESGDVRLQISAEIDPKSSASAARAFQLMLALQDLGQIEHMTPSQEEIENASPVRKIQAQLVTGSSEVEVRQALIAIPEITGVEVMSLPPAPEPGSGPAEGGSTSTDADLPSTEDPSKLRLGDFLVARGYITKDQLNAALELQSTQPEGKHMLGQILVSMGTLSQEALDRAIAEQIASLRSALEAGRTQASDRAQAQPDKTVRTSVEHLDNLMNLVGELITDRNRLYQIRNGLDYCASGKDQIEALNETISQIGRTTDQLQAAVMGIRMLPISNVFNKFPRLVRDLARKAGKLVDLIIQGEDTELDRSVIEQISDPLIHLLRNAVDHGIETPEERESAGKPRSGTITLSAQHEQGRIVLAVEDDGRGIDADAVRASAIKKGLIAQSEAKALQDDEAIDLIFLSGLSTAKSVSDVSGRGVGMDIVRANIERLNGNILIETWPGRGTRFHVALPLTLAVVPTLLVRVGASTFAIPIVTIDETVRLPRSKIQTINSKPVISLRDRLLPVARLSDLFGISMPSNTRAESGDEYIVVVCSGKAHMGLIVDGLMGEQELVVKSLNKVVGETIGISSAAILGDGRVTLIVEVEGLVKQAAQNPPDYFPRVPALSRMESLR